MSVLASLFLACSPVPQDDTAARIDRYVRPLVASKLFSGVVLVARGGEVIVERAYGKAHEADGTDNTTTTRCKIMSVTKPITAVAVMSLVERGELSLADPVSEHLRPFPAAWKRVTIRDLLSHTSGIPNLEREWAMHTRQTGERGIGIWPALAKRIADRPLAGVPGKTAGYSNFNFVLLGLVIEAASGQPYSEFMKKTVFDPAGMKHTGIDDGSRFPGLAMGYFRGGRGTVRESSQDMSVIEAAGGIYTTVGDLYRLDRALYTDDLLGAATRERMFEPVTKYFSCGWRIVADLGRKCIQHSGGANGYVADFLRFPDDDACVVVISNYAFAPIGKISHDLARILFGMEHDTPAAADPKALAACAGVYRLEPDNGYALMIRQSGATLLAYEVWPRLERCGGKLLLPLSGGAFALPWGNAQLRFASRTGGAFTKATLRRAGHATALRRTAIDPGPWKKACRVYDVTPPRLHTAEIVQRGDGLALTFQGGWPASVRLEPVSSTVAIALVSDTVGTLLRLREDGFRWQRTDGVSFAGRKR